MTPQELIEKHRITMETRFIPFSQSRNKAEKHKSLNWVVTILCNGREVITTDYSAGCGHCPAYKKPVTRNGKVDKYAQQSLIDYECEKGMTARASVGFSGLVYAKPGGAKIEPELKDVLYSLVMDSDVLNYSTFEEWAQNFGYETDSRKAEKIYNECLKIALKVRAGLGQEFLTDAKQAYEDY